jgi:hypothetical protein
MVLHRVSLKLTMAYVKYNRWILRGGDNCLLRLTNLIPWKVLLIHNLFGDECCERADERNMIYK